MSFSLDRFIAAAAGASTPRELMAIFSTEMQTLGFTAIRYLVLAQAFRSTAPADAIRWASFPADWLNAYQRDTTYSIDPFVAHARRTHTPFYWRDAVAAANLDDRQRSFVDGLHALGFRDGLAVPIFTRPGEIAYFGFTARNKLLRLAEKDLLEIQAACQIAHIRYSRLRQDEPPPQLTPRECEVLSWIARGKSNASIAAILGVSPHTVDTLVRRSYRKLGVTTRLEATLRALGLGVIEI